MRVVAEGNMIKDLPAPAPKSPGHLELGSKAFSGHRRRRAGERARQRLARRLAQATCIALHPELRPGQSEIFQLFNLTSLECAAPDTTELEAARCGLR